MNMSYSTAILEFTLDLDSISKNITQNRKSPPNPRFDAEGRGLNNLNHLLIVAKHNS